MTGPIDDTVDDGDVAAAVDAVRARVAAAGGDPGGLTIVAVTKDHGPAAVRAAVTAGLHDVGENRAQELEAKATSAPDGLRWHFIGPVQRNKVRRVAAVVHLWQSVDRVAAGEEIAKRAPGAAVLVQVNVSGEPQKHGCGLAEAPALADQLAGLGLDVRGVMAIGPSGPPEDARPGFRRLRALADRLALPECSMGMSDDLEVAVQEGATIVRVGRALFGPRAAAR